VLDARDDHADGDDGVSRSLWRCRNRACSEPHGAVLGHVTADRGLVLDQSVDMYNIYMDTRRAVVICPGCGARREFQGDAVFSAVRTEPKSS
jgi:hypothetical protein